MISKDVVNFTRRRFLQNGCASSLAFLTGACLFKSYEDVLGAEPEPSDANKSFPSGYSFTLTSKYDRKTDSYTQGLIYEDDDSLGKGVLYESGGKYGRSLLRKVDAETGKVFKQIKIPTQYFAEGIATVGNRIYMLTWRERACLVFDKETFEQVDEFRYAGEGWGLAYDGKSLIMSDGSAKIRFLDPKTFRQQRSIDVHYVTSTGKRRPILSLNELEFINGEIWANVYQQDYVVRIDPSSGLLLGNAINFSTLIPKSFKSSTEYVLNGLAWDKKRRRLFVTGKCWPVMYVFALEPKNDETSPSKEK